MILRTLLLIIALAVPAVAQDRSATGGAQTLEDILARQAGQELDDGFRRENTGDPDSAAAMASQLGTLGGASDPDLWRALRYGTADITVSSGGEVAKTLVQDGGMAWYQFRSGPLATYGSYLLLGTIVALVLFYLLRGKIRVDGGLSGRTILRFRGIERLAHWTLAISFIILGFTGLFVKYGRDVIVPLLGKDANATVLVWSKFIHNNISWAFMVALVLIFVMWVWHNLPSRTDIVWFIQAGGIIGSKHPPAKKFNAGQKIIFWSCIVFGGAISASGLSLLFPFDYPFMAQAYGLLNDAGIPALISLNPLPVSLAPQEEMQAVQALHAIASFILMAIIIAHIYIGSVGMEGASGAMTTGKVDEAWAHQHHSIWLDEVKAREGRAHPAE